MRQGDCGDHEIVAADDLALSFEMVADFAAVRHTRRIKSKSSGVETF